MRDRILFTLVLIVAGIGAIAQTLPEEFHQSEIKLNPNLGDTPVLDFLDADKVRPFFRTTTDAEGWEDMGMATYRDDLATSIWAGGPVTYQVAMQKSRTTEGLYRLVCPYGGNTFPYAMTGDYGKGYNCDKDYYMTIHAEDPSKVWIELEEQMDGELGKCIFGSLVSYYLSQGHSLDDLKEEYPEYFGTLVNGLITMPKNMMVCSLTEYHNGFYNANLSGLFAVALPGIELLDDYFVVRYNWLNENVLNTEVSCNVYLGNDTGIDSVCVAFISETDAADAAKLNAVIENLKNGTHNNVIREKYGDIYYLNADGLPGEKHHIIAVEAGDKGERFALSSPFMLPGWTPAYEGKYYPHILMGWEEYAQQMGAFCIYQSSVDKTKFIIREWSYAPFLVGIDMVLAQPFTFTMNEDGYCKVDAFNIGYLHNSYGEYIKCSEAETYYKNIGQGYNGATSRYDAEAGEFHFELSYYISQGTFGVGTEHFVIDKNLTAIEDVITPTRDTDVPMFDLMGRRVFEGYKGIVVKNGKKYILR